MPAIFRLPALSVLLCWTIAGPGLHAEPPPERSPAECGMSATRLAAIDRVVADGLARKNMPGAVVVVGRRHGIVLRKAYGLRAIQPAPEPMTLDTVFDLASLTKPLATGLSVMRLVQEGRVDLEAPVKTYLPEFTGDGRDAVTVRHLLTHTGGLSSGLSITSFASGIEQARANVVTAKLSFAPGAKFVYSDTSFLLLGELVGRVTNQPLDVYTRTVLYEPLGLRDTGFRPDAALRARCAPTERRGETWMRGDVHDPRAWALEGVAGHAGLFSTADDLAVLATALLRGGEYRGTRILDEATVERMFAAQPLPDGGARGLAWDKRTSYSINGGDLLTAAACGHGGFTGTALWLDPAQDLYVLFLSNRVHPDGQGLVNPLIGRVATLAAAAIREP
jgi:serine-type D-Ala-D-Ala carboxypeptidase